MRSLGTSLLAMLLCASAQAQDPTLSARAPEGALRPLSARGRQLLDGAIGGAYSNEREPGIFLRTPAYRVYVQPSWIYFVRDRVGLGAYFSYQLARPAGYDLRGEQYTPAPNGDKPPQSETLTYRPLAHDFSAGIAAALELAASERVSLFLRPYVGVTMAWRSRKALQTLGPYSDLPGNAWPIVDTFHERQIYVHAGLRIPVLYQVSSNLGFGIGPDILWERPPSFNSFRVGLSSWIAWVL